MRKRKDNSAAHLYQPPPSIYGSSLSFEDHPNPATESKRKEKKSGRK